MHGSELHRKKTSGGMDGRGVHGKDAAVGGAAVVPGAASRERKGASTKKKRDEHAQDAGRDESDIAGRGGRGGKRVMLSRPPRRRAAPGSQLEHLG